MGSNSQARGGEPTGHIVDVDTHIPTVRAAGNRPAHAAPPTSGAAAAVSADVTPPSDPDEEPPADEGAR
ncbi:MAG: hypothetical protein JWM98_51 [Thermoleophilia bacterium]|nr:hypothetical protein [Thermoleophilia bacterium]